MAGGFGQWIEELSGLASLLAGLLFLFMAIQMAFYTRGVIEAIAVAFLTLWSLALLLASRRSGRKVVLFRIVSVALLVGGSILAAVFLPPLHRG
jgi:hypothetical protein